LWELVRWRHRIGWSCCYSPRAVKYNACIPPRTDTCVDIGGQSALDRIATARITVRTIRRPRRGFFRGLRAASIAGLK
jgi:hypothetical protein